MPEKRAAKILVRQSDLAARLGLPAGTTVHRMEMDTTELDPVLELTVTGPSYPLKQEYCELERMPIENVAATQIYATMPTGDAVNDEMERVKAQVYERHAQGLSTKLMADGEVIGEIPAPTGCVQWIGGTAVVQADDFIRAGSDVTGGPNGGVIEWREEDGGKPIGRAMHTAHRGEGVKVTGFGTDPR